MITLHRAIVSLSGPLCTQGRTIQDRIVFFESQPGREADFTIERILHGVWRIDTAGWCERGYIYNCCAEEELLAQGMSSGDLRLLEVAWVGGRPRFARAEDVELFVTPRRRLRLDAALRQVEQQLIGAAA